MDDNSDIEELRKKRREELKEQVENSEQGHAPSQDSLEQQKQEQEAVRKSILRQALTEDARKRISNVRLVDEDKADKVEETLIQLSQNNQLPEKVNEEQIKNILHEVSDASEYNIKGMSSRKF